MSGMFYYYICFKYLYGVMLTATREGPPPRMRSGKPPLLLTSRSTMTPNHQPSISMLKASETLNPMLSSNKESSSSSVSSPLFSPHSPEPRMKTATSMAQIAGMVEMMVQMVLAAGVRMRMNHRREWIRVDLRLMVVELELAGVDRVFGAGREVRLRMELHLMDRVVAVVGMDSRKGRRPVSFPLLFIFFSSFR